MRTPGMILLAVLCAACRASVPVSPEVGEASSVSRREVWVDGAHSGAAEPGDGTRARPFRALREALALPGLVTVHVAPGRYAGPFELPEGLRLEGAGDATVLHAGGEETVARARGGAVLANLVLQGGRWGLEGEGTLRLESVVFQGQGSGAVRKGAGRLEARGSRFEAAEPEAVGVSLEGRAVGEVRDSDFSGPYRRGVHLRGGAEVLLEDVRFRGARTAVEQAGGRSLLRRVSLEGGSGPGVWVMDGAVGLEEVAVTGHEFGLAAHGAEVDVRGFTSVRGRRAGLAVVESRGRLEEVVVRDSGPFGALQLVNSELTLRRFRVDGADAYGVQATNGRLKASEGVIRRVYSSERVFGDGLHLRGVVAELEELEVRDVVGAGLLAAQGAEVTLRDVTLSGCEEAGVVVENHGAVTARGLDVKGSGGPALAALRDGVLRVDALKAEENKEGLLWAECEGGTSVQLGRYEAAAPEKPTAPCIKKWTPTPLPLGEGQGEGVGQPSPHPE